jgi:hypothetical protein
MGQQLNSVRTAGQKERVKLAFKWAAGINKALMPRRVQKETPVDILMRHGPKTPAG